MISFPGREFVLVRLRDDLIHVADRANDLHPILIWDDRGLVFILLDKLIRADANDQVIALLLGLFQYIQMPDILYAP